MAMKYDHPEEGEWIFPVRKGYRHCCCDCGLVHDVDFRVQEGRIEFRVFRNNRSTGQIRRYSNIKVVYR